MSRELNMSVSQVLEKEGKKCAFVYFDDGTRNAEGRIPDCVIISSQGFSEEEIAQLENYMRKELPNLKKMASGVNVMSAFMKD